MYRGFTDKLRMRESLVESYMNLEKYSEAIENLETLIEYIPENEDYINNYIAC